MTEQTHPAPDQRKIQLPWAGLGTALAWAISPIFIRIGLTQVPAPLVGVTVGIIVNVLIYSVLVWWRRAEWRGKLIPRSAITWQVAAAVFVSLATWARWTALTLAPVAVVTAIERLSVPVVIVLSLVMLDQTHERVNWRVWFGGAMIVGGALLLTVTGGR